MRLVSSVRRRLTSTRELRSPTQHLPRGPGRGLAALVIGTALIAALAGCSPDESDPIPEETSSSPTAGAESVEPAWMSDYSAEELEAYEDALAQYDAYLSESEPIWAAGKATPAAKSVFQKHFTSWPVYWKQLQDLDQANVRIPQNGEVLDSQATRVELGDDGTSVTIQQCVDATGFQATQDGKPLPNVFDTPQLNEIVMSQVEGRWYVRSLPTTSEDRPCGA